MKHFFRCVFIVVGSISFASSFLGCASMLKSATNPNYSLNQGNIELNLRSGRTTKAEVLEKFGSPNIVTRDGACREVWMYQRAMQSSQRDQLSSYATLLLAGQSRHRKSFVSASRMVTLIIKFNSHDVVEDFSSRTSCF